LGRFKKIASGTYPFIDIVIVLAIIWVKIFFTMKSVEAPREVDFTIEAKFLSALGLFSVLFPFYFVKFHYVCRFGLLSLL